MILKIDRITFGHAEATQSLFVDATAHFPVGWTGIVGPNGSGKTTLMQIACGILAVGKGRVEIPGRALYCPQRTDAAPDSFDEFVTAEGKEAFRLRHALGIDGAWVNRWDSLSHGERKRAQIGVALWSEPDVLAVDEPTNHIDADARQMLTQALHAFRGIGILVSHDRMLLDDLCGQCIFVQPPDVTVRPGGYTEASAQARLEMESDRRAVEAAGRHAARLDREADRRTRAAARSDKLLSKRHIAPKDSDARAKVNLAKLSGMDGRAGRMASQMKDRARRAREEMSSMRVHKTYETGIWINAEPAGRSILVSLPPGAIRLGDGRAVRHPEITVTPTDRIGITGPNGAGKSTLTNKIIAAAAGFRNSDNRPGNADFTGALNARMPPPDSLPGLPAERVVYIPQEITASESTEVIQTIRKLSRDDLGRIMTIVSRLGSRPGRLMETAMPSPGEMRKLMLALGISRNPWMIVMDEPTNHLDLPAIECLESALADCPCALILVSHDEAFLQNLTTIRWDIRDGVLTVG